MEMDKKRILLITVTVFLSAMLVSVILFQELVIFLNVLIMGVIVIVLPFSIYQFIEFKRIKNCEDEFPNFLRDLAEAKRSGLSLIQAIRSCSKSDYGALTQEIVRLNNKLTWNIQLKDVLKEFGEKFKKSSIISHTILIISQMEESGGKTEDIMDSLADNIESIREVQMEKRTLMNQHVMSMYAIFFIFFGISVALIKFLIPLMEVQEEMGGIGIGSLGTFGGSPCQVCIGVNSGECITCNIFFTTCSIFNFGSNSSPKCYYKSLYFFMIIIQGIFSGLVAGQISSDSIIAGVKHSLIMTVSGFVLFLSVSSIGII